jgi:branched-chain amino acid transport system ATP-binding protein
MAGLLELVRVTKYFDSLAAVLDLDMTVKEGEILGLIGPNGAGKTTVFNLISGFLAPTYGSIKFKGADITGWPPHRIASKGIVRTFQLNALFWEMSVLENVLLGGHLSASFSPRRVLSFLFPSGREIERAMEMLYLVGLAHAKDELAGNLPHGQQRLLQLAVALAARPELLLLDEPVSGMTAQEITAVMELLRKVRDRGVTILLVEHNMRAVMTTCDRIVVMSFGRKIAEGRPQEVSNNKEVIEAYLGAEAASS